MNAKALIEATFGTAGPELIADLKRLQAKYPMLEFDALDIEDFDGTTQYVNIFKPYSTDHDADLKFLTRLAFGKLGYSREGATTSRELFECNLINEGVEDVGDGIRALLTYAEWWKDAHTRSIDGWQIKLHKNLSVFSFSWGEKAVKIVPIESRNLLHGLLSRHGNIPESVVKEALAMLSEQGVNSLRDADRLPRYFE